MITWGLRAPPKPPNARAGGVAAVAREWPTIDPLEHSCVKRRMRRGLSKEFYKAIALIAVVFMLVLAPAFFTTDPKTLNISMGLLFVVVLVMNLRPATRYHRRRSRSAATTPASPARRSRRDCASRCASRA